MEFVFHPPRFLLPTAKPAEPVRMLTHRNRISDSLMSNLSTRLAERTAHKKKSTDKPLPEWLTDMLVPHPDDPDAFTMPICVMPTKLDPLASLASAHTNPYVGLRPGHITRTAFYKLAYDEPLQSAFRHKQFVEFPTVEVWEDGAFTGTIVDERGSIVRKYDGTNDEDVPRPKRRKMNRKEGKKTLGGLLGGYGSASEEDEDEKEEKNVLNMLSGYAGSDDEEDDHEEHSQTEVETEKARQRAEFESQFDFELGDEDAEGETDDGEGEFEGDDEVWGEEDMAAVVDGSSAQSPEALAAILEQLRQAGALRDPGLDSHFGGAPPADDDQVDWGDSADENDS